MFSDIAPEILSFSNLRPNTILKEVVRMLLVFLLLPRILIFILLSHTSGAPNIFSRYSLKPYTENSYGVSLGTRNKTG